MKNYQISLELFYGIYFEKKKYRLFNDNDKHVQKWGVEKKLDRLLKTGKVVARKKRGRSNKNLDLAGENPETIVPGTSVIKEHKMTPSFTYRYYILLLFVFFIAQNTATAQIQLKIDSLKKIFAVLKEDTNKANVANKITRIYIDNVNYEEGLRFGNQALLLCEKLEYRNGIVVAANNLGICYAYFGSYENASANFWKSLKSSEEIGDKRKTIVAYNNIATFIYQPQGNYEKQLEFSLKALNIEEEIADPEMIAVALWKIGTAYFHLCKQAIRSGDSIDANLNYEKLIESHLKALKIWEKKKDKDGIAFMSSVLAFDYDKCNLCDESKLASQTKLIKSNQYKVAEELYFKALQIHKERGNMEGICSSYQEIASFYKNQGNLLAEKNNPISAAKSYAIALKYNLKNLELIEKLGYKHGIAYSNQELGKIYMKLGNENRAEIHFLKAADIFEKRGFKEGVKDNYLLLSDAAIKKSDFKKAVEYYKMYVNVKDTLLNDKTTRQIYELGARYEIEKSDLENKAIKIEARTQRLYKYIAIMATCTILLISVVLLKKRKKEHELKNHALKLEIRQKISKDLHDDLSSGLTSIAMICEKGKIESNAESETIPYEKIKNQTSNLHQKLGELVWANDPETDNLSSLCAFIRNYGSSFFENSTIRYYHEFPRNLPDLKLNPDIKRNLFLVLKEALHNCVKHSEAVTVKVILQISTNKDYVLEILDDGKGIGSKFDFDFRNGLKNMRRRIEDIKGKFEIISEPGKGTIIRASGNLS